MPRRLPGWTLTLAIAGLPSSSALRDKIKSLDVELKDEQRLEWLLFADLLQEEKLLVKVNQLKPSCFWELKRSGVLLEETPFGFETPPFSL